MQLLCREVAHNKGFSAVPAAYKNSLWSPRSFGELSAEFMVFRGTSHVVLGPLGTLMDILGAYGNFPCNPGSLWDLSVRSWLIFATLCGILGPYGNFLCGPGAYREISAWSMVLMGTSRVVIGLSGSFVCDPGSLRELLCGPRSSWGLSVPS